MVDSFKNLTSLTNSPSGVPQGDSLRKNLKAISSVSVSRTSESIAAAQNASSVDQANSAVGKLTDSIRLSADALRALRDAGEGTVENREVAEENLNAATTTPEDLEQVQRRAEDTGAAIQFHHDEALHAHGDGVSPESVFRLLQE